MKKTFLLLLLMYVFLLCGCVKVEPREETKNGVPLYGSEYSMLDPENITVLIDNERYSRVKNNATWGTWREEKVYGWVDCGKVGEGMLTQAVDKKQDDVFFMTLLRPSGEASTFLICKEGKSVPIISAGTVSEIEYQTDSALESTQDRVLIDALFREILTGEVRKTEYDWGWYEDGVEQQDGKYFLVCGQFPDLRNEFWLYYDEKIEQYFVSYQFERGAGMQNVFISDELAQKLMAI